MNHVPLSLGCGKLYLQHHIEKNVGGPGASVDWVLDKHTS